MSSLLWRSPKLPLELEMSGPSARIYRFVRKGGRCPSQNFLKGIEKRWVLKFQGSFYALTVQGKNFANHERFKPLTKKEGKPLWEFKEHAYRLYCVRTVKGDAVDIILLNGWSKDKEGRSKEEDLQIATAMSLFEEYGAETEVRRTK